jgi:threonyl-tRNA synthetase
MSEAKERKSLEERHQVSDLQRLRHSCAHVLATAVLRIWPEAQLAGGPAVESGFFYDIDLTHHITPDDFERIEAEMKKVVNENSPFTKRTVSREEALELIEKGRIGSLEDRGYASKYKKELLNDIPEGEEISLFDNNGFLDLCAGPHVPRTGNCKAFKVMSVASAFFKGDKDRETLQRLYGTCFPNKTELAEHLEKLEEAKKRDHRKLGRELGLFHIDDAVGQGLILWKPKGAWIRRELQDFITKELDKQGYSQIFTPHLGKLELYRTSGHFPYYEESQFAAIPERDALTKLSEAGASCSELVDGLRSGDVEGFMLSPMNCPHHIKIYESDYHSYKDLPVRLAEFGTVYRWEMSGELGGMTRVRGFTQDDAHIFCTPEQLLGEIQQCLGLVNTVLEKLGINDYRVRVGLRDRDKGKFVGEAEDWNRAEDALREAVKVLGVDYSEEEGEAAFYGPKVDFVVKDVIGREWQLGTVQVDYQLPQRFNLSYIGADNRKHVPVMIHRAPFGSLERFTGLLIEHFEGKFPTWLAPEQVRIIPLSDKFLEPAEAARKRLADENVRVTTDQSAEKVGAKIRNARLDRVPYMLVIGAREAETNSVSVRHRDLDDMGSRNLEKFVSDIVSEIKNRALKPEIDNSKE